MNMKRMRGRNHRSGGGGGGGGGGPVRQHGGGIPLNRNHVFDSNGPDLRVRGTAQQLFERYLQLGRDATSVGDRVMAESYFQHAEHYFRILNAMTQAQQQGHGGVANAGQNGPGQNGPGQGGANPNGQQRRPSMHDTGLDDGSDQDEADGELPGLGEQPGAEANGSDDGAMLTDSRRIPIAAAPPEA